MVKLTEGSKCHSSKETAIHCFINSTKCAIFSSGIWPKPNARKWRLQARWGGFPLPWLGVQQPTACRGLGGQMRPTARLILGLSQPLPGGGCYVALSVAPCKPLGGLPVRRAGHKWRTRKNASSGYSERCKRDSCGSWPNAS
jgi:hypothetical protein